jgi:hypothetical protein
MGLSSTLLGEFKFSNPQHFSAECITMGLSSTQLGEFKFTYGIKYLH